MTGAELFEELDAALPLVLLPVRLVTRFHRPDPGSPPRELHLRIHPDVVHGDAHDPTLTEQEELLGNAYWQRVGKAAGDEALLADARRWLADQLDPYRAAWVAGRLGPQGKLLGPVERRTAPRPTIARLLPDRWLAIGFVSGEEQGRWWSRPVTANLPMAPNLTALEAGDGVRAFLRRQGLEWMADFDAAVAAGMALRIPLDNITALQGFSELVVVGVADRADDSDALAELLDAHRHTEGLDFVPQGSPTNNTETVASAVSTDAPDLGPLFASEIAPSDPGPRPPLTDPAVLYRARAGHAASVALGLSEPNALDRAANASMAEAERSYAMNQALFGSTLGYLLTSPLAHEGGAVLGPEDLAWLRGWFCDYARGGAHLPVLRIGEQPYGLLPVTSMSFFAFGTTPVTRRGWLEKTVADLLVSWTGSRHRVPTLSPVPGAAAPGAGPGEEAVNVASVLGAVPHPTRLRLRQAPDERDALTVHWNGLLADFEASMAGVPPPHGPNILFEYHAREDEIRGQGGVRQQIATLSALRTELESSAGEWADSAGDNPYLSLGADIEALLLPPLERHNDRAKIREIVSGFPLEAPLPNPEDPPLWYVLYDEPDDDEQAPTLLVVDRDPTVVAAQLRQLASGQLPPGPFIPIPPSVPRSLLWRLIDRSLDLVEPAFETAVRAALVRLAEVAEGETADPVGELERLVAETLGLLTHRLDAWTAGLAAERLAEKRKTTAGGVQVGAYGWVVNLRADLGEPDTQGFIHAPSLAHAATAAVLRSAWSAFSTEASAAAFAVDLSSERVRRAEWILGGVRNGQGLDELLGGRFERRLHDALLDTYIESIRTAVLTAHDSTAPPSAVVDGLALAVAYADVANPPAGDSVRTKVDAVLATAGADAGQLRVLLHQASVDLDAVSDALTAQAVHSVLTGDLAEAAAATAAMGSGDSGVPELRYAHVHRESDLVVHRVSALFGDEPPAADSLLATIEPGLCAWVERLLAGLETMRAHATFLDAEGRPLGVADFPLAALGLAAYEILAVAPLGDRADSGRLARLVAGWARRFEAASVELAAVARVAVELPPELTALGPLRQAIGRARPLGAHDLTLEEGEPAPDVADLELRRERTAERLLELGGAAVGSDELLRTRLADLAAIDVAGTIAALDADVPADRTAAVDAVAQRAVAAARALDAPLPDGWDELTTVGQAAHLTERLAAATRIPLPVLPRFTPADTSGLREAFDAGETRAGSPLAIAAWLLQVGRVHPAAGLVHEGLGLLELVGADARAAFGLAQLPSVPGEPWAAVARAQGGRTCLVSVTDWRAALAAPALSGLLFDAWAEPVPRRDVMTGVAVHFDSPSARPPQAVLLMTVEPDPGFSVDAVVSILTDTLEVARCRAIGTETLDSLGHYLPGLFVPAGWAVAVDEEVAP